MEMVTIRAKRGFLANTTEKEHAAHKFTEDGKTLFEVWYGGSRVVLSADMVEEVPPIETYYFIKSISTATETNPSFAGEVHIRVSGKGEEDIFCETPDGWYNKDFTMYAYGIMEYGYKRLCDAKRSYSYKHPQNDQHWTTTVKIVTFDVQKGTDGKYHVV